MFSIIVAVLFAVKIHSNSVHCLPNDSCVFQFVFTDFACCLADLLSLKSRLGLWSCLIDRPLTNLLVAICTKCKWSSLEKQSIVKRHAFVGIAKNICGANPFLYFCYKAVCPYLLSKMCSTRCENIRLYKLKSRDRGYHVQ